jgi:hypothetical protein
MTKGLVTSHIVWDVNYSIVTYWHHVGCLCVSFDEQERGSLNKQ